jgi:hypothetical protein
MNPEVTERLRKPIPRELIKQLNGNDYISGQTAIDRLIQATDNDWSFKITNVVHGNGHVAMQGELTIAGHTRSAWGEAKTTNNAKEELFKNAETDTLKRCARLFGVALELYGDLLDEETGEITHRATAQPRQNAPQARQKPHGGRYAQAAANATQDAPAAPQAATGNVSEKQEKFIRSLIHELEWTREDVERFLKMTYGVERISDLPTRQDVSAFIDHLQELKAQNEPAGVS